MQLAVSRINRRSWSIWTIAAAFIAVAIALPGIQHVQAHAELVRSDPPSEGLLSAPPQQIELWFSEDVATGAGSPGVTVLDEQGQDVPVENVRVDPGDARHVIADLNSLLPGRLTVAWTVRSASDGHTLNGSFSFRVGGGRAPGAATVEGERPQRWAVATRWLTFLGIALAAGGLLFERTLLRGAVDAEASRRRRLRGALIGASVALAATVSEPFLQTVWPRAGTVAPSLDDAIAGLPNAWWIRPVALVATIGLVLAASRWSSRAPAVEWLGGGVALAGLLGLSLTSHAASETGAWHIPALAADTLHQLSIALWVGGLVHLMLWWSGQRRSSSTEPEETAGTPRQVLFRFSRYALVLVAVGIGTGLLNAGLLLPAVDALWTTDYGIVLLVKIAILIAPLALALFHHRAIRRAVARFLPAMRRTVRLEAALVVIVVAGGSILVLMAPPVETAETSQIADVPKPAMQAYQGQDLLVHLLMTPGRAGDNQLGIRLTNFDKSPFTGEQPALIRLRAVSLGQEVEIGPVALQPSSAGDWLAGDVAITFDGWWRIEATLRWLGQEDIVVPFYLILPDPNLNGFDAIDTPAADPEAAALYEQAMAAYTGLHTVHYIQTMSSHTGNVALARHVINDGSDGSTPGYSYEAAGGYEAVVLGTTGWMRKAGEEWRVIGVNPMVPPSGWDDEYAGATGFQLGRVEEVNGEPAQVITFVVPGNGVQVTAWYVWWLGLSSGQVLRDVMVSNSHYMTSDFSAFNEPVTLTPPAGANATPKR